MLVYCTVIKLHKLYASYLPAVKIREDAGTEPDHIIGVKLFASQSRLDYMGTSVLMGRVSSFAVTVRDEWKLKQCAEDGDDATRRLINSNVADILVERALLASSVPLSYP